jgi:hypothetical protein
MLEIFKRDYNLNALVTTKKSRPTDLQCDGQSGRSKEFLMNL